MTLSEISTHIRARIAEWSGVPADRMRWPNRPGRFETPSKGAWVDIAIKPGASVTQEIGNGPSARRTGLIIINLFDRRDAGTATLAGIADSLTHQLEYYTTGAFNCREASYSDLGDDGHGFYQMQVQVPYYTA